MSSPEAVPAEPKGSMTPQEYLARADQEWDKGNHREAAGLLWKATKATFVELALAHGLEYDDYLIDLAKALEENGVMPKGYFRSNLGAAKLLRDHAVLEVLEEYELKDAYEGAREFILELHSELE